MNAAQSQSGTTSFVIFGITGNLARYKLIPSLYKLFVRGKLPSHFNITGFGRKEYTVSEFREEMRGIVVGVALPERLIGEKEDLIDEFIRHCFYIKGQLDHGADYERLKQHIDAKHTTSAYFYISLPPTHHATIVDQLGWMQLLQTSETYIPAVMIEKPFGENEKTAKELDRILKKYVTEEQIYRIDHYLGKDVLHKLEEDKKNVLFTHFWNDTYIEKIEAKIHETKDIGSRGEFYDAVGALTDVGQNHVLQMLSAILVLHSVDSTDEYISKLRAKVLNSFQIIASKSTRGQYNGYLSVPGVSKDSKTETYFKAELTTKLPQWKKTQFSVSAGKALSVDTASLHITFRDLSKKSSKKSKKVVNKKPLVIEINMPHIVPLERMDAYEHVFYAALKRERRIFISLDEAIAGWRFVKKMKDIWKKKKVPLDIYTRGSRI